MALPLSGRVCIVTGGSRGIGKGIAVQLGGAGATVYVTGRTLSPTDKSLGSLEETVQEINHRGGHGIAVQCDHSKKEDVQKLFDLVDEKQQGRLDLLVNCAFNGQKLIENVGKTFYESSVEQWDDAVNISLSNYYYCNWHAAKLMVPRKQGLIITISSAASLQYSHNVAIGVQKEASDRLAVDCGIELRKHNVASVSLWPGLTNTEMLKELLHNEDFLKDNPFADMLEKQSKGEFLESPEFSGRAVVALMTDKNLMKKSCRVLIVAELAKEYGFKDITGTQPLTFRSLKAILIMAGYERLAWFVPAFIKLPYWLLTLSTNKF